MTHIFICYCEYPSGQSREWNGIWTEAGDHELIITGRGSMLRVILGECSAGNYICIPDLGAGSSLSSLSDVFWNYERLSELVNRTDAATISYALADYIKYNAER